jgi:DTW domain-containing protein YfiP
MTDSKLIRIEESRDRSRAALGMEIPVEPFANSTRVLILQHPQEPDKELGSASLLVRALENAELKIGLSWRSLKTVAGENALPAEWAVLYLGAKGKIFPEVVNFVSQKNNPIPQPPGIKGLIVLDGTWSQAKALWWRNPWLLKVKRVVLQPKQASIYGNLRREPRAEALSTIESCALALERLDRKGTEVRSHLEDAFQRMLAEYKSRRRGPKGPITPPAAP